MTNTKIQQKIEEFRKLGLESLFRLDRKVFSDKTGMQLIEEFFAEALQEVAESARKEADAYKGKLKREWYMKGVKERERIIDELPHYPECKMNGEYTIHRARVCDCPLASSSQQQASEEKECKCELIGGVMYKGDCSIHAHKTGCKELQEQLNPKTEE